MSTPTTNYGLQKDLPGESYDVAVVNANLDKIDAAIHNAEFAFYTNGAGTDSYAVAIPGVTNYAQLLGKSLYIKATVANTAAASLNVNTLGAINIVRGTATALTTGDITANKIIHVIYDGTNFQLMSQAVDASTASKVETLTGKTLTAPKFVNAGFIADANGNEEVCFYTVASAVNCFSVTDAATGNNPIFSGSGDDPNVGIDFKGKGSGLLRFFVNSVVGFVVDATALAVNYIKAKGAIAGASPTIEVLGTDANINLNFVSKGTGTVQANGKKVATVSSEVSATLTAAGWTGAMAPYSITVAVAGVLAGNLTNQDMFLDPAITAAAYDAFGKGKIIGYTQAAGTVTLRALGTKPAVDIPVVFTVRGDI